VRTQLPHHALVQVQVQVLALVQVQVLALVQVQVLALQSIGRRRSALWPRLHLRRAVVE
jgi:hypothetical protein